MKKLAFCLLLACLLNPNLQAGSLSDLFSPLKLLLISALSFGTVAGATKAYTQVKDKREGQADSTRQALKDSRDKKTQLAKIKPKAIGVKKVNTEKQGKESKPIVQNMMSAEGNVQHQENVSYDEVEDAKEESQVIGEIPDVVVSGDEPIKSDSSQVPEVEIESALKAFHLSEVNGSKALDHQEAQVTEPNEARWVTTISLSDAAEDERKKAIAEQKRITSEQEEQAQKLKEREDQLLLHIKDHVFLSRKSEYLEKKITRYKTEADRMFAAIEDAETEVEWDKAKQDDAFELKARYQNEIDTLEGALSEHWKDLDDTLGDGSPKLKAYNSLEEQKAQLIRYRRGNLIQIKNRRRKDYYLNDSLTMWRNQGRVAEVMLEKLEPEFNEIQSQLADLNEEIKYLNTHGYGWLDGQKKRIYMETEPGSWAKFKKWEWGEHEPDSPETRNIFLRAYRWYATIPPSF